MNILDKLKAAGKNGDGHGRDPVPPGGCIRCYSDANECQSFMLTKGTIRCFGQARHPADWVEVDQCEYQHKSCATPHKSRFQFIDSTAFASGDYRPEWLVKGVLVKGQPAIVAGPSKALKTNIGIDLAVSLAAGVPFLGEFKIPEGKTVAVVSAESGAATIQETARRVCRAKGINLADLGERIRWCFDIPRFSDLENMDDLAVELGLYGTDLVLLDPLYLMLGDIDAKNMFEMGSSLRLVSEVLMKAGPTPLLFHHSNKQLPVGEPMELQHLAYSGLEQFARQFILLNRREKYEDDGNHELWFRIGGSAGHGGLWNLHIEEGITDENFQGRRWDVKLQTLAQVKEEMMDRKEELKRKLAEDKAKETQSAILEAIDAEVKAHGGATKNTIRERTGLSSAKLSTILEDLIDGGTIEECEFKKKVGNGAEQSNHGYRRCQSEH